MSGSRSSPSLVQSSRTMLFRPALESPSARAKMQREQKQMMKELEKLEKQASVAVSNVDTNRHAIKLLQQQIERRRSDTEAPSIQRSSARKKHSLQERRTILQNQTIVAVPSSSEFGMRTSSLAGQTDQPAGDEAVEQQQSEDKDSQPDEMLPTTDPVRSPYISSPLLYTRRNQLPKPFKSPVSSLALYTSSPGKTEEEERLPMTVHARPGTATKNKLKRVNLGGLGLDASSSGPESFKHFYNSGSQFASAVFDPTSIEDDVEDEQGRKKGGREPITEPQTLEEMFEDIRRCRYIRTYQPRGGRKISQAWQTHGQFDRKRSNTTSHH